MDVRRVDALREEYPNCRELQVPEEAVEWSVSELTLFFASCGEIAPRSQAERRSAEAAWEQKLLRDREVRRWRESERAGLEALARVSPAPIASRDASHFERAARGLDAREPSVVDGLERSWCKTAAAARRPEAREEIAMLVRPPAGTGEPLAVSTPTRCGLSAVARKALGRQADALRERLDLLARLGSGAARAHLAAGGWLTVCPVGGLHKEGYASDSSDDSLVAVSALAPVRGDRTETRIPRLAALPTTVLARLPNRGALGCCCRSLAALVLSDELWRASPRSWVPGGRDLAVSRTATLDAWGNGARGQLGLGDCQPRRAPCRVLLSDQQNVSRIDARGDASACAYADGRVFAWGEGRPEPVQLECDALPEEEEEEEPVDIEVLEGLVVVVRYSRGRERLFRVPGTARDVASTRGSFVWGSAVLQVARVAPARTAAVTADGKLLLLLLRANTSSRKPTRLLPYHRVVQIAAAAFDDKDNSFLALTDAGRVVEILTTTTADSRATRPVEGLRDVVWIGAGEAFAAALDDDGGLFAWGRDETLLSQPRVSAPWPVWPLATHKVLAAAAGRAHLLALSLPRSRAAAALVPHGSWFVSHRHRRPRVSARGEWATRPFDVGGVQLSGPLELTEKPLERWEVETHALLVYLVAQRKLKVDELRSGIEALDAHRYAAWSYYSKWAASMATASLARGYVLEDELNSALGGAANQQSTHEPAFQEGDVVRVKRDDSSLCRWRKPHVRVPGYVFGAVGVVERYRGTFDDPEFLAFRGTPGAMPLYTVRFAHAALGWEGNATVTAEIYQGWLERSEDDDPSSSGGGDLLFAKTKTKTKTTTPDHHHHHHHDDHEHPSRYETELRAVEKQAPETPGERLTGALVRTLAANGHVELADLRKAIEEVERLAAPATPDSIGPRVVARAWKSPEFKRRLLDDAQAALADEFGVDATNSTAPTKLVVVADEPGLKNLAVCTLCSCYPITLLGISPSWYKDVKYRARAIRDPRELLKSDFGLDLPASTHIKVHDATADCRYLVLPEPPPGVDLRDDERDLARLVTRDSMIGVSLILSTTR
ncbi:hypothetical protein CTAYLR_009985 [Chrysophaeum taylorii]|uniref:Nitrile hydratase n=1 Tax=Chrysophaeum taylorii TaxID=2483200 RepID=A0AAD7UI05_9STRA|nr:hypothetical protein CTAYLR_009985 [Chrysophaeum taylorii]